MENTHYLHPRRTGSIKNQIVRKVRYDKKTNISGDASGKSSGGAQFRVFCEELANPVRGLDDPIRNQRIIASDLQPNQIKVVQRFRR